ncbi:hypothetical protein ACS0TY_029112 [Phlomoides rotata]
MGMESEHVNETVEHVRNCSQPEPEPELEYEDNKIFVELASVSSSSSSSSSRSSVEIDFDSKNPFNEDSKSDGKHLHGQESSLDQTSQWSMTSTSPPFEHLSHMTSPKVQSMGHPTGYDPNRIPLSVFSSKPANASEWSTASNESLFSIHMGNNSFSRDILWRSGELSRLDELDHELKQSELSSAFSAGLPPVLEVSANEENGVKTSSASHVDSTNSLKVAPEVPKMTVTSSHLSEESSRSSSSFAFPVLVSDSGKTSSLKGVDVKADETELQTGESKPHQKSSIGRWFSWLSCLPRCC